MVLLNADIVSIICELLDPPTLATLARTARFLLDPAVRELWREIHCLSDLLHPFGSSISRMDSGVMTFSELPTTMQWDRFSFYARHVRILELGGLNADHFGCFSILSSRRPLLPHLQSLVIMEPFPAALFGLLNFFTGSLQNFDMEYYDDEVSILDPFIATLATTAPTLKHLNVKLLETNRFEFGASVLLFHKLCSIDIPLAGLQARPILSHLSTLPSLSRIAFGLTPSANLSGGRFDRFPAATHLTIRNYASNDLLHLMAITRFDTLTNLDLESDQPVDIEHIFDAISTCCGRCLGRIFIGFSYVSGRPECRKFPSFHPLRKFTDLRDFSLQWDRSFYPTDEDIADIAKAWPKLEDFHICLDHPDEPSSPFTLSGLLLLIEQCTALMSISIAIDTRHFPSIRRLISRPGLIITITPQYSPIDCPKSLANFLDSVLPDAHFDITCRFDSNYSLWAEVESLRQQFCKTQQEEKEHAVKQIK